MKKAGINNFMVVIVLCLFNGLAAEPETIRHSPKQGGTLSILVLGDWGRKGTYNQTLVANQMGIVAEKLEVDFVISTGDNFYDDGLTDVHDSAFDESFTNIYTAPSLQTQWYTVLGNHDYRGDVLAELSPSLTERDSRWFCRRSYILNSEMADIFFVDTTPFQDKYFDDPEDHTYDWRDILPRTKYLANLIEDLDLGLKKSSAKWKIVVGHHTIKSAGHHGNTQELVKQLLPVLQDNDVDLYINGHDHCLQHICSPHSPLQFLTSGGGSKAWKGEIRWWNPNEMKFYYDGQGFMTFRAIFCITGLLPNPSTQSCKLLIQT